MFLRQAGLSQAGLLNVAKTLILITGLSLFLSACGTRGPLEAPPEAKAVDSATAVEEKKPHRGFILDGLLN